MPRLLSRMKLSPRAERRVHVFATVAFGCVAAVSWWGVATEGSSTARVISAIFSTVVVLLELLLPGRKRLLRRPGRPTEADRGAQSQSREEVQ